MVWRTVPSYFFYFFLMSAQISEEMPINLPCLEKGGTFHIYCREQDRGHHKMAQRSASHIFPIQSKLEDPLTEMLI